MFFEGLNWYHKAKKWKDNQTRVLLIKQVILKQFYKLEFTLCHAFIRNFHTREVTTRPLKNHNDNVSIKYNNPAS